jgi:hypothetical protein
MSDSNGAVPDLDIDAWIDGAQPPERTIALCTRGDLVARFEELERELEVAREAQGDSLASGGRAREIAEEMEALRVAMRASTKTVVLRALVPRKRWQALGEQHPPRRDEDGNVLAEDRRVGVNNDTFWDPAIRACWASPALTKAQLTKLLDVLSNNQYDTLAALVLEVNMGDVDIPFSPAASRLIQTSSSE